MQSTEPNLETKPSTGTTVIIDLETNGLLKNTSTIHCLVIHDLETGLTERFNDTGSEESIIRGAQYIEIADRIIGHNIIGFDLPIIKKMYSWFDPKGEIIDTLVLSRLYHPNLMEIDKRRNWKHMPLQLYGRHSLEAYGYRLGEYKGNFGKETDWSTWSQEMEDYCVQDVAVTKKLCNHFHRYLNGSN
tara:strand:- start:297 stop:860 length:564 start_codon:yes stop_codon:yes gene_type:complete